MWLILLTLESNRVLHSQTELTRKDFRSDAGFIIGTFRPDRQPSDAERRVKLATTLIDSLDEMQRKRILHSLGSDEKTKWTNTPARGNPGGLALKDLSPAQTKNFCNLLSSLTSKHGYQKITQIMLGDDLRSTEFGRPNPGVGINAFRVVLFGKPDKEKPWGFQLDGHHIAFNGTSVANQLTMSPSFFGTKPDVFSVAKKQMKPLDKEVSLAYQLVNSLSIEQKRLAIIDDSRGRIFLGPGWNGNLPKQQGIIANTLSSDQQKTLLGLVDQWISILPKQIHDQRLKEVKKDWNRTTFSWNGETKEGSDISFSVMGPTISIEFACQGRGGGNPTQHPHSMYRNPKNDYGIQFLYEKQTQLNSGAIPLKSNVVIDQNNSSIQFIGRHNSKKPKPRLGGFKKFSGTIQFDANMKIPKSIDIIFDMNSIWTKYTSLTEHLEGEEFFNVKTFPRAKFRSTQISKTGNDKLKITGQLKLHGVENEVVVPAVLNMKDGYFSLQGNFRLDRTNFGLTKMTGGVSKWVEIKINLGTASKFRKSVKGNGSDGRKKYETVKILPGEENLQLVKLNLPGMT